MKAEVTIRVKALTLVVILALTTLIVICLYGCAPQESSSSTSTEENGEETVQVDFEFSADADCLTCHETESASFTDNSCPASNHTELTCVDCHTDIDGLTSVHDEVAYGDKTPTRLKSTEIDESTCLTSECHGSYEELAEATAESTVLTDSEDTVVNPHDMPESEDHETIDCGSCHSMHSSDSITDTAQNACLSCHHMGVYECYTCHD